MCRQEKLNWRIRSSKCSIVTARLVYGRSPKRRASRRTKPVVERSARALKSLIDRGKLLAKGSGRSTVYVKAEDIAEKRSSTPKNSEASSKVDDPFKVIDLTPESQNLLRYISQPIPARTPVGYNQDFLRSIEPNETYYLDAGQRKCLHNLGRCGGDRGDCWNLRSDDTGPTPSSTCLGIRVDSRGTHIPFWRRRD